MKRPFPAFLLSLGLAACASTPPLPPPPPPPFQAFNLYGPEPEALPDPAAEAAIIRQRAAAANYPLDEQGLFSNLVQNFAVRARRAALPGFNEVWVERDTARQWVNVGSSLPADRAAYLAMAAPELHPQIRFRKTLFDKSGTDAALTRLIDAYGQDKGVCLMMYEHSGDWFVVVFEDTADEAAIRSATPKDLAPFVRFERGGCPILV